ncbi:MAG: M1 family metallopeptidase [Anaerolineae bacterium]|nr:M1 family metallopeptidase [Anaerolineae bacterium]
MKRRPALGLLLTTWMAVSLSCFPLARLPGTSTLGAATALSTAAAESAGTETNLATRPLPPPTLFKTGWEDRTPWQVGLIPEARKTLAELPAAPVYHMDVILQEDLIHLTVRQEVLYTNLEGTPLDRLYFHLYPNLFGGRLEITSARLNGNSAPVTLEQNDALLRLPFSPALGQGEAVVIALDFNVTVPTGGNSNYNTFAYSDGVLALAQFYPILAVYAPGEGWDTQLPPAYGDVLYADASLYQIRLTAPASVELVSSGVVTHQEEKKNQQIQTIAAGPVREFYLAARQEFDKISRKSGGTIINSYAPPGSEESARLVLETAASALESFNNRIGPFPFTEYDLVATATDALGVEYPGVVAISGHLYAPKGSEANTLGGIYLESTVAHETAHQWFYGIIGNDQIREPWLDEAMAQYSTWLYFLDRYGAEGAGGYRQSWQQRWETVKKEKIPIGLPVADYSPQEYSAIVYGRGPIFIQELEKEMGKQAFAAFLQTYYQAYQWKIAAGKDFKALAEQQCACNLTPLFEQWVNSQ